MDDEFDYIVSEDSASNNPLDDDLMTYMMFFADEEEAQAQAQASHGPHNLTQPNYGCVVVAIAAVIVVLLIFLYVLFQS